MDFLMDPSIWVGLLTLVVLEIILGIDNLMFIAILAEKLPPSQRDKARIIGLSLALFMRLGLLSAISWVISLTTPLFSVAGFSFSGRNLILLVGGLFLLFKATVELHERLEGQTHLNNSNRGYAKFWAVVVQIVILDAVFSLDAVITAVGMVKDLPVMMAAVVISLGVMLAASKPLTKFVNAHPTVVVLCLSFLLMIGLSLIAEGFGAHIPKGYLYAAIGFSLVIELFNQIARRNLIKHQTLRPIRERTAEAIMRLMGQQHTLQTDEAKASTKNETFAEEERYMINGVLTLASRSLRSVMTPRTDISWVDCNRSREEVREQLLDTPHSLFPVCRDSLDKIIGVVRAKDLLVTVEQGGNIAEFAARTPPIVVPETMDVINLLAVLRRAKGRLVVVNNEFGVIQGLITPLDVLEAIAGEFPDEDETPEIMTETNSWLVKGRADMHSLEQTLSCEDLVSPRSDYATLAGFLLARHGKMPEAGDVIELNQLRFEVIAVSEYRIELVRITKVKSNIEKN